MTLNSAEIKRQILMNAGKSEIKKKMDKTPPGISEGEQIEMGNDLDALSKSRGWALLEVYMLRRMNLVGLVLSDEENKDQKGIARGYIELMQWMDLVVQKRNELLEKERLKHAKAEDVSKNEGE